MKPIINIKSGYLFPMQFRFLGAALLFVGMVTLVIKPFVAPILLILGLLQATSYFGVELNTDKSRYREFRSFLLIKTGKWLDYDAVEKIYINSSNVSQKIYTRVTTGSTIKTTMYDAYLRFENGTKVYLTSKKNKEALQGKLADIATHFSIDITDNTI